LVEAGAIGQVRAITVRLYQRVPPLDPERPDWRYTPQVGGGGRFVDMGCHTLDFLDYILGPIRQVSGYAANQGGHYPAEDVVTASFVFESGVHGVGAWCFTSFQEFDETELAGTRGSITFPSFDNQPVVLTTDEGVTHFAIDNPPHVHQPLTQTVVDELNGVGTCPSSGVSGARTTWVMDQVLEDYRRQTRPVSA
jgi:predicted dehydrogenase